MMRAELEPLGFAVEWIDMRADRPRRASDRAPQGQVRAASKMLLIGHLDTVFEPDSPFQRWERKGNDGDGPGAGDDKGGMVVMVAALRAMKARGHARARRHHRRPDRRRGG